MRSEDQGPDGTRLGLRNVGTWTVVPGGPSLLPGVSVDAFRKAKQPVLQLCQPSHGGPARPQVAVVVPSMSRIALPTRFGTVPPTQELSEWSQGQWAPKAVHEVLRRRFKGFEIATGRGTRRGPGVWPSITYRTRRT